MYKRTGRQSDNPCINEWCGECEPIMSDCKLLFKHNNFYLLFSPLKVDTVIVEYKNFSYSSMFEIIFINNDLSYKNSNNAVSLAN